MQAEFVVRAIAREMQPGWRLLTPQGYAARLTLSKRDPHPDWDEAYQKLLAMDLDSEGSAERAAELLRGL